MSNKIRYEKNIEILNYELLGELPDPFVFNDGSRLTDPADWSQRRVEIYKDTIELQFGTMPPEPEFLEVEPLYFCGAGKLNSYRINTGTRNTPISFTMYVFRANGGGKAPAVISGDLCFAAMWEDDRAATLVNENINFVLFNRTELAADIANYNLNDLDDSTGEYSLGREIYDSTISQGQCGGQVKRAYPEYSFGTSGAWAWGYSRCVDALEILGFADMDLIAFTGHSRGGKTAALAGALDERAAIVNPNATCAGGNSSYRINIEARIEDGSVKKS